MVKVEAVVEDVGVVGVEVQVVEVEEMGKIEEVKVKPVVKIRVQVRGQGQDQVTPGTRRPGTRTCLHLKPASAIGPMASQLISVLSQQPVHGRIILYQNPIIKPEVLTSSAEKIK